MTLALAGYPLSSRTSSTRVSQTRAAELGGEYQPRLGPLIPGAQPFGAVLASIERTREAPGGSGLELACPGTRTRGRRGYGDPATSKKSANSATHKLENQTNCHGFLTLSALGRHVHSSVPWHAPLMISVCKVPESDPSSCGV